MKLSTVVAAAALVFAASQAKSEEYHSYLVENQDPPSAHLTFSPCTGEEVAECVSYSLSCDPAQTPPLQVGVLTGPVEKMAIALIKASEGIYAHVGFSGGSTKVDAPMSTIRVDTNEMDGGWMLTVGTYDEEAFRNALPAGDGEGATMTVGGETFQLSPQKGDGAKLVQWRDACKRIRGN